MLLPDAVVKHMLNCTPWNATNILGKQMTFLIQLLLVSQLACFVRPRCDLALVLFLPCYVLSFGGDRLNVSRQA